MTDYIVCSCLCPLRITSFSHFHSSYHPARMCYYSLYNTTRNWSLKCKYVEKLKLNNPPSCCHRRPRTFKHDPPPGPQYCDGKLVVFFNLRHFLVICEEVLLFQCRLIEQSVGKGFKWLVSLNIHCTLEGIWTVWLNMCYVIKNQSRHQSGSRLLRPPRDLVSASVADYCWMFSFILTYYSVISSLHVDRTHWCFSIPHQRAKFYLYKYNCPHVTCSFISGASPGCESAAGCW